MQEGTWQGTVLVQCKLIERAHTNYRWVVVATGKKVSWDRSCVIFAGQTDDAVLLDFSKAFDKVSRHLLLT